MARWVRVVGLCHEDKSASREQHLLPSGDFPAPSGDFPSGVWGCLPAHWRGGSERSHRGLWVAVVPLRRACCRRGLMCASPERRHAQVGCVATAPRQLVLLRPVQRRSVLRRAGCRGAGKAVHKAMVQRGHGQRGQATRPRCGGMTEWHMGVAAVPPLQSIGLSFQRPSPTSAVIFRSNGQAPP